jgi:hypothetical protein
VVNINFYIPSRQSHHGLEDIIAAFYYSLKVTDDSLTYTISNSLDNKSVNLIFEEFTTSNLRDIVKELDNECKKFLIITEFFSKEGFNIFSVKDRLLNLLNFTPRKYMKNRYKTFKFIIKKVKFDGFVVLHPAIVNHNFRNLISKSRNSDVKLSIFLPILPTNNLNRDFSQLKSVEKQSDHYAKFNDSLYFQNNPDIHSNWKGNEFLHFIRYGKNENRNYFNDFKNLSFVTAFKLLQAQTWKKRLPNVGIYSSGSLTRYREKILGALKESPQALSHLGFEFEINIEIGWDNYSYSIENLFSDAMSDVYQSYLIDLSVSQSESWPFISPIRIWRSYACGLFPLRFCGAVDIAHPLQKVVEQVNQDYQVVSYSWALRNQDFRRHLLTETDLYNESAIYEIRKLIATFKFYF